MRLDIVLNVILAIAVIGSALQSVSHSMRYNLWTAATTPASFLICFILQVSGVFRTAVSGSLNGILSMVGVESKLDTLSADARIFVTSVLTVLFATLSFVAAFLLIKWLLRFILRFFIVENELIWKKEQEERERKRELRKSLQKGIRQAQKDTPEGEESALLPIGIEELDEEEEPKGKLPDWAQLLIGMGVRVLCGLLFSAVVLMPVFQVMSLGSAVCAAYDENLTDS